MRMREGEVVSRPSDSALISREYLTGFHKRKVAKKQEAVERAKLREKRERQELRLEVCLRSLTRCFGDSMSLSNSVGGPWLNRLHKMLAKSKRLTELPWVSIAVGLIPSH